MFGLLFGVVMGAVGGAIDITSLQNADIELQAAIDGAALAGARAYQSNEDTDVTIKVAENFFDAAIQDIPRVSATRSFRVVTDQETGSVTVVGTGEGTLDGYFLKNLLKAGIGGEATLSGSAPDLYLYFLIDATGSMQRTIDGVRNATKSLEGDLRARLNAEEIEIDHILAKIGFFRDLRSVESRPAWIESPVYDLAVGNDVQAMHAMLDGEPARAGGDLPESSLAAIGEALSAPLPPEFDPDNVIQVIVLWTDAASLPLEGAPREDDITVALWKRLGAPNTGIAGYWRWYGGKGPFWNEAAVRTWPSPNAQDGCCTSLAELETVWKTGGTVPLRNRRLGIRAPSGKYPWQQVRQWPNTAFKNFSTPSGGKSIVDDIFNALGTKYSPLRVSR